MSITEVPKMTDVLSAKLLPCPFCGGPADILAEGRETYVACMDGDECGAEGHRSLIDAYAVETWNRRAISLPITAEPGEVVAYTTQRMLDAMKEPDTICGTIWPKEAKLANIPLYARSQGMEVKVKPLEWVDGKAKTAQATYAVEKTMFGWVWVAMTGVGAFAATSRVATEDEAKAGAQAYHDKAILSTLTGKE